MRSLGVCGLKIQDLSRAQRKRSGIAVFHDDPPFLDRAWHFRPRRAGHSHGPAASEPRLWLLRGFKGPYSREFVQYDRFGPDPGDILGADRTTKRRSVKNGADREAGPHQSADSSRVREQSLMFANIA